MASKKNSLFANQLITKEDLGEFKSTLLAEIREIINYNPQPQKWIRSSDVRTILKISPATLQTLRVNGTLQFSKIGKIFYYKSEEIEKLFK